MAEEIASPVKQDDTKQPPEEMTIVDVESTDAAPLANEKSFNVEWRNPETGKTLIGTFTARRPSLSGAGQIGVIRARLNADLHAVDGNTDFIHQMMAFCQVTLVATPTWWNPAEFYDPTPLRLVWNHVQRWLENFHQRRVAK